jgi:hypothetical protein
LYLSKYLGVKYQDDTKKWLATVRGHVLGSFNLEKEAAAAYDEKALAVFGAQTAVNFPVTTAGAQDGTPGEMQAVRRWRSAKVEEWRLADSKLRRKHPRRESLDAWMDKQCATAARNKAAGLQDLQAQVDDHGPGTQVPRVPALGDEPDEVPALR